MTNLNYETCDRCNYDMHLCPGCGAPLSHGVEICEDCRVLYSVPEKDTDND